MAQLKAATETTPSPDVSPLRPCLPRLLRKETFVDKKTRSGIQGGEDEVLAPSSAPNNIFNGASVAMLKKGASLERADSLGEGSIVLRKSINKSGRMILARDSSRAATESSRNSFGSDLDEESESLGEKSVGLRAGGPTPRPIQRLKAVDSERDQSPAGMRASAADKGK